MENTIEHHGVKGQKWGVKRKRYSESLDDKDHTVKSGTEISRISSKNNERLGRKATYVTTNKHDSDEYLGNYAGLMDKAYSMKMRNVKDLVSPSAKKRAEIYMDLYKNDPVFRRSFASAVRKTTIPGALGLGGSKKAYIKRYGNLSDDKLDTEKMLRKISSTMAVSNKVRDSVLNKTLEKGYNSIVDDNDAGRYSKEALIVINANRDLKLKSVSEVTDKVRNEAFKRALDYTNKRRNSKKLRSDFTSVGL